MTQARQVEIVEVGPRDGYQGIGPFIPTETKIAMIERLVAAGLRRIEIGSFVSPSAVPQLRDTPELLAACGSPRPQSPGPGARARRGRKIRCRPARRGSSSCSR